MYILGLHNDEDSGVCLLKNGQIIDVINEERLTRKKLQGGFPTLSLKYLLKKNNLKIENIDYFAYGWHGRQHDYSSYFLKLLNRVLTCNLKNKKIYDLIFERLRVEFGRDNTTYNKFLASIKKHKIPIEKTHFFDHHASHAWSAFSCSPYKKAIVFTMDARGDLKSASVSIADQKYGLKELTNNLSFDSLGFLYGQITYYLGFKPHRHEGKVTGLAAYGNPKKTKHIFEKLIKWDGKKIVSNLGYYRPFFTNINPDLIKDLKKYSREDIAAGVQYHCEQIVVKFIKYWIKKINRSDIKSVCLAGGLFANVKINQKVSEINGVKDLFVFPHMGDGGLTVGAACQLKYKIFKKTKVKLNSVYFGSKYSDIEIYKELTKFKKKINIKKTNDIADVVARSILKDQVVGFFQGRMEFGPRALGCRSILYHARDKNVNDWLNKRLRRTEFMPFAPVTPFKLAKKCYLKWNKKNLNTKFMTQTFKCTDSFVAKHPAVVHIDNTARPQVITPKINKIYYDVVSKYCQLSKESSLINTSFNQHEQPIVCSPKDAVISLLSDNVDVLSIGSYIVEKKKI